MKAPDLLFDRDRTFPIERWLDDPVYDTQLEAAVIKARTELHDFSEEQVHELWEQVWMRLRQYASENGYTPATIRTGVEVMTRWLPPEADSSVASHADNVGLLIDHCLCVGYPPFLELIEEIDENPHFGVCRILAVLALHETASGNFEGAIEAANCLDAMYGHIRPLAQYGYASKSGRSRGGTTTSEDRRTKTAEEIARVEKELSEMEPHNRASKIAKRLGLDQSTVRRHRRRTVSD